MTHKKRAARVDSRRTTSAPAVVAVAGVVGRGMVTVREDGNGEGRWQRRGRMVTASRRRSPTWLRRRAVAPLVGGGALHRLLPLSARPRPFFRPLPDRLPKPAGASARSPICPLSHPATQRALPRGRLRRRRAWRRPHSNSPHGFLVKFHNQFPSAQKLT